MENWRHLAVTDIVQRIYAAIHLESAEMAPRTSALIEAAREGAKELERRGAALRVIADWPAFVVRGDWERMTSYAREQIEKSATADKEQT